MLTGSASRLQITSGFAEGASLSRLFRRGEQPRGTCCSTAANLVSQCCWQDPTSRAARPRRQRRPEAPGQIVVQRGERPFIHLYTNTHTILAVNNLDNAASEACIFPSRGQWQSEPSEATWRHGGKRQFWGSLSAGTTDGALSSLHLANVVLRLE